MEVLDLQLQIGQRDGELTVFMQSPTQNASFQVAFPFEAVEWQQEWRRQFLAFHDPANTAVTADAVSNFGTGLHQALSEWLALPGCDLLRQSLSNHPGLPLRLSFTGEDAARLEQLPWELIFPDRNCWRLIKKSEPNKVHTPKHSRRPRILVIAGEIAAGALDQELDRLRQLSRQGRIDLELLNGSACTLVALKNNSVPDKVGILFFSDTRRQIPPEGTDADRRRQLGYSCCLHRRSAAMTMGCHWLSSIAVVVWTWPAAGDCRGAVGALFPRTRAMCCRFKGFLGAFGIP